MIVIAARPFAEDFVITPEIEEILGRHTVWVVPDPGNGSELLSEAVALVTGFENQVYKAPDYVRLMPRLRWIHSLTAGLGAVASPEIAVRNVLVTNAAGVFADAIAEYAVAALVMLARELPQIVLDGASRRWGSPRLGQELRGRRAGIIGFGGIGRRVAELLAGVGMTVSAVTRTPGDHDRGPLERLMGPDELTRLVAQSDAVILCASANPTSERLLSRHQFSHFKHGSLFVNVSRGSLVDEGALIDALSDGVLSGAMIDVTATEPLGPESPLWEVPNLWITPHMSGGTSEGRTRSLDRFLVNLDLFAAGKVDRMVAVVDLRRETIDAETDAPPS
jgi:phosphoglycerate dehydrogenase-like enzyme